MGSSNNHNSFFLTWWFGKLPKGYHGVVEPISFQEVVRCNDRLSLVNLLWEPFEKLWMNNLIATTSQNHRLTPEIDLFLLIAYPKLVVSELPREGHTFRELLQLGNILLLNCQWRHQYLELSLAYLDQELTVVEQLNLFNLVHRIEYACLPFIC